MMKKKLLLLAVLGLALAACGNSDGADEGEEEGEGFRGEQPCLATPAPIEDPMFPGGFPEIDDVTWTASREAGPSRVVSGYTSDTLEALFGELKEKFDGGGYSVTKDERERHDAEVNFESDDNSGQVRLGEECQGRRSVIITIRPS
jgi:hypothetical protein